MENKPYSGNTITLHVDLNARIRGFSGADTITPAHRKIMRHYASPLLAGPSPSDELLELVCHMFTEDEADLVQHLPPLSARTAAKLARLSGRSEKNARKVMDHLALTKAVILAAGKPRKYSILPILPGTFEMALMTPDISTRNDWHKQFAEIFERVWDTGFVKDYIKGSRPPVRYLPVNSVQKTLHRAWPSDRLEEILEPFQDFAVGNCQCRMAMQLVGKGCGKPMENCVSIGPFSEIMIRRGFMRKAEKQEVLEIKQDAESHGLVTWMLNEADDLRGNGSCSCCGCCCHGLRSITEFNAPGFISKPHFMPKKNSHKCTNCGKCILACPMSAWKQGETAPVMDTMRCIGCGLCVVSCSGGALELTPVEDAKPPEEDWLRLLLKMAPGYLSNTLRVLRKRFLQHN